jgi:hypothetical protein
MPVSAGFRTPRRWSSTRDASETTAGTAAPTPTPLRHAMPAGASRSRRVPALTPTRERRHAQPRCPLGPRLIARALWRAAERYHEIALVHQRWAGRLGCRDWDREPRHPYSHEHSPAPGSPWGADERFGLDVSTPKRRRVNLIERQRDRCESEAVTDACTDQRPGWSPTLHRRRCHVARAVASDRR